MLIRRRLKFIFHILSIDFLYRINYIFVNDRKNRNMFTVAASVADKPVVYVIQEIPGTKAGTPKINIMSASKYGRFKFLLPEFSQIIFSPGPLIFKLRAALKHYNKKDYLLLTGDPAIIGVACSIVSQLTNGKYNLLKWDKQERQYYPITINLNEKGEIDE